VSKPECQFCGRGGCTLECAELLEFAGHRQQFLSFLPHDGDMRRGYHLRTDGSPSPKAFIYSYHKSYFTEAVRKDQPT
jgi:hypothetical protein